MHPKNDWKNPTRHLSSRNSIFNAKKDKQNQTYGLEKIPFEIENSNGKVVD